MNTAHTRIADPRAVAEHADASSPGERTKGAAQGRQAHTVDQSPRDAAQRKVIGHLMRGAPAPLRGEFSASPAAHTSIPTMRAADPRPLVDRAAAHSPGDRARGAAPGRPAHVGDLSPRVAAQRRVIDGLMRGAPAPSSGEFSASPVPHTSIPIQRLRDDAAFAESSQHLGDDERLGAIRHALSLYGPSQTEGETQQEFADRRARALDDAEHQVYGYLGAMGDLGQGGARRDYMLDFMDEIQEAHRDHVDYVHQNNLALFSAEDLDVADRAGLNQAWDDVRGGQGTFVFDQGADHEADNRETRANFARLMSRRSGRELVQGLREPPAEEGIDPYRVRLQPTTRMTDGQRSERQRNLRAYERVRAPYVEIMNATQGRALTDAEQELIDLRREAMMPFLDESRDDFRSMEVAEEPAAASKDVGGNSASLRVLRGLRDSENFNRAGIAGDLIASPAHVVLGHELVHALHYKRGLDDPGNPADYDAGSGQQHWTNAEEHRTIDTGPGPTENSLRAEHGLTARIGHTSKTRRELVAEEGTGDRRRLAKAGGGALALGGLAALGGGLAGLGAVASLGLGLGVAALGGLGYAAWRRSRR